MPNSIRLHQVSTLDSKAKLILLLLSIFVGYIARPAAGDLSSDYDKINDYLLKNIKNSHEPSINMDALRKWNSTTCCQGCYQEYYDSKPSYCETLNRLFRLPKILHVGSCNQESAKTLVEFDSDLGHYTRSDSDNFSYSRLQRIIERYAYDWSVMCLGTGCCRRSRLPYLFKERAYDQINSYLVNHTKSADAELNMAKADEYLQTLISDQEQEGVKTDALRQLVAIRSVADERMCNGKGFEIMFKNDLATGGSAHTNKMKPIRRIDKLVHHYSLMNAKLCQPVYRRELEDRLNETSYRNVGCPPVTLVSIRQVPQNNVTDNRASVTPWTIDGGKIAESSGQPSENRELSSSNVHSCLLVSSQGDPDAIYLGRVPDEISGEHVVVGEKVHELFDEYLLKPCKNFIDTLGKEVFRPSSYAKIIDDDQNKDERYYRASAAYESCRAIVNNSERMIIDLIASYAPVAGKSSFYGY